MKLFGIIPFRGRSETTISILIILSIFLFACLKQTNESTNTKRTRCNRNAADTMLRKDICEIILPIYYGKPDPQRQKTFNDTLTLCLLYNLEMYKCEKKSDVLPS